MFEKEYKDRVVQVKICLRRNKDWVEHEWKNGAADEDDGGERQSRECWYSLKDQSIGKEH